MLRIVQSVLVFVVALILEFTPTALALDPISCFVFVLIMFVLSFKELRGLINELLNVSDEENEAIKRAVEIRNLNTNTVTLESPLKADNNFIMESPQKNVIQPPKLSIVENMFVPDEVKSINEIKPVKYE